MSTTEEDILATTINFANNDVCSWKFIPSTTEMYFNRNYNLTLETMIDVECEIVYGPTRDQMTNSITCLNGTSFLDIPSD